MEKVPYQKTKNGIISIMHKNQRARSIQRGHPEPTYTFKELKEWMLGQELFHTLYKEWEESGYKRQLAPSCDRNNQELGYSFDNITLKTLRQNQMTQTNFGQKEVIQYDDDMNEVARFDSATEAARITGNKQQNISSACLGKYRQKKVGGFHWKYS